jgi:hypothetical protein
MNTNLSRRHALGLATLVAIYPLMAAIPTATAQGLPLAIKGYDPVAYFTDAQPTLGSPDIELAWDDHRYRFATVAHRDMFKGDPPRYAPQFGNFCAMALAKGELVEANPENWLINDGKLYVFGKGPPAGPVLFQKDLAANISKANHNRSLLPPKP